MGERPDVPTSKDAAREALVRLLDELPFEFSTAPTGDPDRGREQFTVIKRRNVNTVHHALWDLQSYFGLNTADSAPTAQPDDPRS